MRPFDLRAKVAFVALFGLLASASEVVDDEYEAVVISAAKQPPRQARQFLLFNNYQLHPENIQLPENYQTQVYYPSVAIPLPSQLTKVAHDCTTQQGLPGKCVTLNNCYPKRKIFKLGPHETWAMGLHDACQVDSPTGLHFYGTCCPKNKTQVDTIGETAHHQRRNNNNNRRAQACLLSSKQKSAVKGTRCKKNNSNDRTVPWKGVLRSSLVDNAPWFTNEKIQGVPKWRLPQRIVNGEEAIKNEYPFIAALLARDSSGTKRQFCGGSLIDEYHILTAAHCVIGYTERDINMLRVRLGAHYLSSTSQTSEHKVDRIIRHIDFKQTTLDYDVAILTLSTPAPTGASNIQRICLPSVSIDYETYQAVVAGWGSTKAVSFHQPDALKKVVVEIWDNSRCSSSYGSDAPGGITSRMMCANLPGADSCQGDSGGPLFTCASQQCTQIGIVSWGISCAHAKYPGVYSRVTNLQEWIDRITSCY